VCASRHSSGTQSILYPRSYYTFGKILPRIIEQSCARDIPLLFPFLLLYNYDVREICYCIVFLFILCVFNDTPQPTAAILRTSGTQSCVLPAHIRHASCTQSILYPRSNFTFGTILPRIIEQSCARDIPLLFPFLLLHILDVREICLMQYVFNNTLHQTHNLSNIRILFYIFMYILHTSAT
jgi:hypothetical protein